MMCAAELTRHRSGYRHYLVVFTLLPLCACAQEPEMRSYRTATVSQGGGDAAKAASLLCRGGGTSQLTYDGKNATFAFQRDVLPANRNTIQPGHCAWMGVGTPDGAPQTLLHASIPQDTAWLKRAADGNALITFQAVDDKAGKILVQKCLSIETATAPAVTLRWTEPIDSTKFGVAPNPKIDGKTLKDVIASTVAGRDDGQLCSACHNSSTAQGGYGVQVEENKAAPIAPGDVVGGKTWAGADGWAQRFIRNETKPANVKAAIQAWIDGGYAQ